MKSALLQAAATLFLWVGSSEGQEWSLVELSASPGSDAFNAPGANRLLENIGEAPPTAVSAGSEELYAEITRRDYIVHDIFINVWNRMQGEYGEAPKARPRAPKIKPAETPTPSVTPEVEPKGGKEVSPKTEDMEAKIEHWAALKEKQLLGEQVSEDGGSLEEEIKKAKKEALLAINSVYPPEKKKFTLSGLFAKSKKPTFSASNNLKDPQVSKMFHLTEALTEASDAEARAKWKAKEEKVTLPPEELQALQAAKYQAALNLQAVAKKNKVRAEAHIAVLTEILEKPLSTPAIADFQTLKAKWEMVRDNVQEAIIYCKMYGVPEDAAQPTPGAEGVEVPAPSPQEPASPSQALVPYPTPSPRPVPAPRSPLSRLLNRVQSMPPVFLPRSPLSRMLRPEPSTHPVALPRKSQSPPDLSTLTSPESSTPSSPEPEVAPEPLITSETVIPLGENTLPPSSVLAEVNPGDQPGGAQASPQPRRPSWKFPAPNLRNIFHPKQ